VSIKLMSLALETTFQPTPKIVLLVMADRAADDGGSLYPSIKEVARKSSLSERQTQRLLQWLDEIDLIPVVGNERGGKPGDTCRRHINVSLLREYANGKPAPRFTQKTGDAKSPLCGETGDFQDTGDTKSRVTFATETGDSEVTQYISDPSISLPNTRARAKATRLPDGWTLTDELRTWAQKERPDLDADKVAEKFRDYWTALPDGPKARKTDWSATWRNFVRSERQTFARGVAAAPRSTGKHAGFDSKDYSAGVNDDGSF
jgi:hypothetical protein